MTKTNWWMYHGDPSHSGSVGGSGIYAHNVNRLQMRHDIELEGPVLSVPAIVDEYLYVGLANSHTAARASGGQFLKLDLKSGQVCARFTWDIDPEEGDSHGFMGMGCTPVVASNPKDGRLYVFFSAFNGKLYCLKADDLDLAWATDLRNQDISHNQPASNVSPNKDDPRAAGWSSPVVANGCVYVGIGEGENPALFGFVYCLDMTSGEVIWIYCTCQFEEHIPNRPNVLPPDVVKGRLNEQFEVAKANPVIRGSSVWSSIAYDESLNRVYCATGNPCPDRPLPTHYYSNGILALDASTGEYRGYFQAFPGSSYRETDTDVDFGGSPALFTRNGRRLVVAGCKNGALFVLDAETMELVRWRQLLPHYNDGSQIPTVDPHLGSNDPRFVPDASDAEDHENYSGTYSTPAIHDDLGRIFIGIGGNNYHDVKAGIDYATTPFLRALDWGSLDDCWEMDSGDPRRYVSSQPPMYRTPGESGLSSPAVVNDVVICSTSRVALYAFDAWNGKPLWEDQLGEQIGGRNGGYGYCLGPAISGNYVVAGALVFAKGGVLRIYELPPEENS